MHTMAKEAIIQQKKLALLLAFVSVCVAGAMVGQAFGFSYLIHAVFLQKKTASDLTFGIVFTGAMIVLRALFSYIQEDMAQTLAARTKKSLREVIWKHFIAQRSMTEEGQGETIHILTEGLDHVENYIARYIPQMAYAVGIPLCMGIAMMWAIPWIGILLFFTYPLIPFFMILIGKKAAKLNEVQWERMSFLSGHFLDVLQGLSTLKVLNRSEEQEAVISRLSGEFRDSTLRVLRVAFLSALVLELISTISTAMIAVYIGVDLLYGMVDFFPAFFILLLAPEFYAPLRELGAAYHTGMAGNVALCKVEAFLETPILEPASGAYRIQDVDAISFEHVSFSYPNQQKRAVSNVSLSLAKGESVMLVGESGAGKTTLAHLFLRLLTPEQGVIAILEGAQTYDLQDIMAESWRKMICYLPQHPYIFKGTIAENIAFHRNVSQEEIERAAQFAEAKSFILSHEKGYDRMLGEGGTGLSGGEKQRIALARAFLDPRPILLFDELSAHLDVETEKAIGRAVKRLMKHRMSVFIGHRIETMHWVDRLYVLRDGECVESGSFIELEEANGYFTELLRRGGGRSA